MDRRWISRDQLRAAGFGTVFAIGFALVTIESAVGEQVVPQRGRIDTDTEVDSVSGFRLGVEAALSPLAGGEAFEEMGAGLGLALVSFVDFGGEISAGLSVAMSLHDDELSEERARLVDVSLRLRWAIDGAPVGLTFGPIIGLSLFRRADFEEWARGFHAGGGLRFERPLGARWAVVAKTDLTWTGFSGLPLPGVGPDPDRSAFGSRGTLSLGLARRLGGRPPLPVP